MSEPDAGAPGAGAKSQVLPPAALDVSEYRRAVEELARPATSVRAALVAFVVCELLLVVGLVVVARALGPDAFAGLFAAGVVITGVLLALLVVLPAQLAVRRRRHLSAEAASLREAGALGIRERMASIGYVVPLETARDWLAPVQLDATVPLVHDSVIAARLWRPAASDDRVFLEPYLRQGDTSSALPALPAV